MDTFAFPKPTRTPKRRKPLQRFTPILPRRRRRRRSERVHDLAHMLGVKQLPCRLSGLEPCRGAPRTHANGEMLWHPPWAIEADHQGPHPLHQKSSDRETVPMCPGHHDDRTNGRGYFKGWDKVRMREWCDEQIAATRGLLASHGHRRG